MSAKCNRVNTVLDKAFPSRMIFMRFEGNGSYMNLKMVAVLMLNKEDKEVTVGINDITKATGRCFTT